MWGLENVSAQPSSPPGFKYRFPPRVPGNKANCISLGRYPDVSLQQARERRDFGRQGEPHIVPLSRQAVRILSEVHPLTADRLLLLHAKPSDSQVHGLPRLQIVGIRLLP